MENVQDKYTQFHKRNQSHHLYPTEWVIRTMLGTYPALTLDKAAYNGGNILDLGFGDGRNISLLHNCGLNVSGVEITDEAVQLVKKNIARIGIEADLRVGSNTNIPFNDNFFDYLLASSSCYYVDGNSSFDDNIREILRVMKPGGFFIANFPAFVDSRDIPHSFILENAVKLDDGHIIIQNDIYGIRNGYKFRAFSSSQELSEYFKDKFTGISIGICMDNYYGVQINYFILVAQKL